MTEAEQAELDALAVRFAQAMQTTVASAYWALVALLKPEYRVTVRLSPPSP